MIAYSALAAVYDALTRDVPYEQWATFAQKAFSKRKKPVKLVLELACGTGSLTRLLGQAGYEMIACDLSADMLAVAREKCGELSCPPVFLCQDVCQLDLYGTIDAAVCCLDSVNYLTELRQLKQAFARVSLFLEPGGLFLFDVKTSLAFEEMGGLSSVEELEGAFCAWQYGYDRKSHRAQHQVDVFLQEEDGTWSRNTEWHEQRAYTREQLEQALQQAGLRVRHVYGSPGGQRVGEQTRRLFFVAEKP